MKASVAWAAEAFFMPFYLGCYSGVPAVPRGIKSFSYVINFLKYRYKVSSLRYIVLFFNGEYVFIVGEYMFFVGEYIFAQGE